MLQIVDDVATLGSVHTEELELKISCNYQKNYICSSVRNEGPAEMI